MPGNDVLHIVHGTIDDLFCVSVKHFAKFVVRHFGEGSPEMFALLMREVRCACLWMTVVVL
jgi:hypothetical protein